MKRAYYPIGLLVGVGVTFSLAGCGGGKRPMPTEFGQRYPVAGKVTFDGKPLRGGNVFFHPQDHSVDQLKPEGLIDSQGNYFVSSYGAKGAPAGKYRVVVLPGSNDKAIDLAVDLQYQNELDTPLTITVQENAPSGAYDLHLKRNLPPPKKR
jgi:hypothetical protein